MQCYGQAEGGERKRESQFQVHTFKMMSFT